MMYMPFDGKSCSKDCVGFDFFSVKVQSCDLTSLPEPQKGYNYFYDFNGTDCAAGKEERLTAIKGGLGCFAAGSSYLSYSCSAQEGHAKLCSDSKCTNCTDTVTTVGCTNDKTSTSSKLVCNPAFVSAPSSMIVLLLALALFFARA